MIPQRLEIETAILIYRDGFIKPIDITTLRKINGNAKGKPSK